MVLTMLQEREEGKRCGEVDQEKGKRGKLAFGFFFGLRIKAQRGGDELLTMTKKGKAVTTKAKKKPPPAKVGIGLWATFILSFFLFIVTLREKKKPFGHGSCSISTLPIVSLLFRCGHAGDRVNITNELTGEDGSSAYRRPLSRAQTLQCIRHVYCDWVLVVMVFSLSFLLSFFLIFLSFILFVFPCCFPLDGPVEGDERATRAKGGTSATMSTRRA